VSGICYHIYKYVYIYKYTYINIHYCTDLVFTSSSSIYNYLLNKADFTFFLKQLKLSNFFNFWRQVFIQLNTHVYQIRVCTLECDTVLLGESFVTFWRIIVTSFSRLKQFKTWPFRLKALQSKMWQICLYHISEHLNFI
jgi:hypothetical protein